MWWGRHALKPIKDIVLIEWNLTTIVDSQFNYYRKNGRDRILNKILYYIFTSYLKFIYCLKSQLWIQHSPNAQVFEYKRKSWTFHILHSQISSDYSTFGETKLNLKDSKDICCLKTNKLAKQQTKWPSPHLEPITYQ